MRIICNQQILAKTLNTVSKAVSNRTTLPILKGILITATKEGKVIFTASDLEISIKKEIEAVVEEPGSIVVMARLFSEIIRKLPEENILIYNDEENSVLIKTNYSEFNVVNFNVDEFPKVGEKEEDSNHINLEKNVFREMVRKTSFAASIDESKGVLTGILTEINKENIRMISLDGFRLALLSKSIKSEKEEKFIISAKVMNEINKIISDDEGEENIDIYIGEKKAVFNIGKTEVVLRIMEGEFIKYKDILPKESNTKVIAKKEILLDSIERASLLSKEGKNNLIKMSLKNDLMTITSRSEEGNVKEEIIIEKSGDDIEIGFNSKFLIDVLKVIDDEKIILNFKTGVSPCVVNPVEGKEYEYLILPVRIPSM